MTLDADFQAESGMSAVMNETRRAQDFLRTLSSETGGFAVVNQNDLNGAFARIIQANSSYYLLGYYPTNDQRDGKFRDVTVRVKRPGLEVKSRRGYTAPKGKPTTRETSATAAAAPPDLRAALNNPMPVNGLGMRVFAAPFAGPSKKGAVVIVVEFDPARLRFEPVPGGGHAEDLELIIVPVNAAGKSLEGARDKAPLRLSQKSYEFARANGLRLTRRLDLPVGRYQLHIAAKASNGNAVGGLTYDLDVPDFSKPAVAMSGLTLTSVSAERILAPPPDAEVHRNPARHRHRAPRLRRVGHALGFRRGVRQQGRNAACSGDKNVGDRRRWEGGIYGVRSAADRGDQCKERRVQPHREDPARRLQAGALRSARGGPRNALRRSVSNARARVQSSMTGIDQDVTATSATGLEPQFAAALAYLAGPFSGAVILIAERTNRFVLFHAWQAIIGLGGLGVLAVTLLVLAFMGLFLSPFAFVALYWLAALTTVIWIIAWAMCLVKAFGGTAWRMPLAGKYAEARALRTVISNQ